MFQLMLRPVLADDLQVNGNFLKGAVKHERKLGSRKGRLSAEEIRSLEIGIIVLVAIKKFLFTGLPVVTIVYPSCPAMLAGIKPGDVLVKAGDYEFKGTDRQKEVWQRLGGRAGTPVDLTIRRKKELITFQLRRMNIEDIENKRIRKQFESIVQRYGKPFAAQPSSDSDSRSIFDEKSEAN